MQDLRAGVGPRAGGPAWQDSPSPYKPYWGKSTSGLTTETLTPCSPGVENEVVLKLHINGRSIGPGRRVPFQAGYPVYQWAREDDLFTMPPTTDGVRDLVLSFDGLAGPTVLAVSAAADRFLWAFAAQPLAAVRLTAVSQELLLAGLLFLGRHLFKEAYHGLVEGLKSAPLTVYLPYRFRDTVGAALWDELTGRFIQALPSAEVFPVTDHVLITRLQVCFGDLITVASQQGGQEYLFVVGITTASLGMREALQRLSRIMYLRDNVGFPVVNASAGNTNVGAFLLKHIRPGGDWLVHPDRDRAAMWHARLMVAAADLVETWKQFHATTHGIFAGIDWDGPGRFLAGPMLVAALYGDMAPPVDPTMRSVSVHLCGPTAPADLVFFGAHMERFGLTRYDAFVYSLDQPGAQLAVFLTVNIDIATALRTYEKTAPLRIALTGARQGGIVASVDALLAMANYDIQPSKLDSDDTVWVLHQFGFGLRRRVYRDDKRLQDLLIREHHLLAARLAGP